MHKYYSYFSPKSEFKNSPVQGIGLFATEFIPEGEIAFVYGGDIITEEETDAFPRSISDNFYHVCDNVYLGVPHLKSYGVNHSCSPNIGVQGQTVFIARRDILAGEELCFDYETTERYDGVWSMQCQCGSPECRGTIDGNAWKDPEFQKRNEGFFSWYLQRKIDALKTGSL
ncbi:MAG TPA: SET domain-containing protein-lysine N-methyltransferase [Ktedonobacteraceae bacterium]|jgi:hypothetical protein|nr:SET domain-containing protein-lysine N-methyltransferase [Ktedonobacteraceae bacterium]